MHILLIEDATDCAEQLIQLLAEIAPRKRVVGRCSSVKESVSWLESNPYPDLILSKVQLPDGLSFSIFPRLERKIPVIFTCEYAQYALEAFKVNSIHYLMKPVKKEDLRIAISRYEERKAGLRKTDPVREPVNAAPSPRYQRRFIVNIGHQMKLLEDAEIAYVFVEDKISYLVSFDNQKFSTDISLEKFEKLLRPDLFFRINRKFIIHLKSIDRMAAASKQRIELTLMPLPRQETITSFERTPSFKKWLLGELESD